MRRPNRRSSATESDLEQLERELAALTLRVAAIRRSLPAQHINPIATRPFTIGDRVQFVLEQRRAEGIVVGITPQRIRIRESNTGHIFLRAPHNIHLLN
jgi:hypothetical protein